MNLRNADLNLLVILQALLDEAHVSRAAERLNLSQPAMSHALGRCRDMFDDPLLVRSPGGLRRTSLAEEIREALPAILHGIDRLIDRQPQSLSTIRQTIRLVISDHPADVVMAPLLARVAADAPGLNLVLHPWHAGDEIDRLIRGELDLVTVVAIPPFPELRSEPLIDVETDILMRKGHPAARRFGLDEWLAWPHLLVSGQGEERGPVDGALAAIGRTRRVAAVVPSFSLALQVLLQSDLIAAFPARRLPADYVRRLAIFDPPLPLPGVTVSLARHRRSDGDLAVRFVADLIRELLAA